MQTFNFSTKNKQIILALGAESAGNFSVFNKNKIYFSQDFGDLLIENNFNNFKKSVLDFFKKEKIKPTVVISDLHPSMETTLWGKELAKKFKAQHIQVQHHHAHIFSAIGEQLLQDTRYKIQDTIYGIAMDGTGYGGDDKIWGGECFAISNIQFPISKQKIQIRRIGSLENQILLGGELAIQEPARMLVSILAKISKKSHQSSVISQKKIIYNFLKKYYTKNEFELLYSQLEQNFNCLETSSAGRILDAVSLLLGFCKNERKYKHEAIDLLEKNSTTPYRNLKPKIVKIKDKYYPLENSTLKIDSKFEIQNSKLILDTTYLFEYLINNLHKDKKRLAATAQLYITQGLHEIIKMSAVISHQSSVNNKIFAAGGIANNKIISKYFQSRNIYLNNIVPRGDAGLSFGQIIWFLFS